MSRWRAFSAVLGIVAFLTFTPAVTGAASAYALPGISDCKDAPTPDSPGNGPSYWFLQPPQTPPPAGDPWAQNPSTTIFEQYGMAGITWQTYDLGCGGVARDPGTIAMNFLNNSTMQGAITVTAVTGWILGAAFNPASLFGELDSYTDKVSSVLREEVFDVWAVPFLIAGAIWLINRARRRDVASIATWVAICVGLTTLLSVLASYPQTAGRTADRVVTSTIGQVSSGFAGQDNSTTDPATAATANIHRAVLYQPWLTGTFGRANNDMAEKYGPALFDSQALTWQQARLPPDQRKKVIEDKQDAYEDTMGKIASEDPSVYATAQGKNPADRLWTSLIAGFAALVASAFLIMSGVLMLVAFIVVRLAVMLAPILIVLGFLPTLFPRVKAIGEGVVTALLGCVAFGIGAALHTLLIGQVMAPDSDLPPMNQILIIGVITVAFFYILYPFANMHRAFRNAFSRARRGVGAFGTRFRDGLRDDTSRADRRLMEDQRERIAAANRDTEARHASAAAFGAESAAQRAESGSAGRPEGRAALPAGSWAVHAERGPGRRNAYAPPWKAPEPSGLPAEKPRELISGIRALPAARADHAPSERVPQEPDAIFRPDAAGTGSTLPSEAARPRIRDGNEVYNLFVPTSPGSHRDTTRPETGSDPR